MRVGRGRWAATAALGAAVVYGAGARGWVVALVAAAFAAGLAGALAAANARAVMEVAPAAETASARRALVAYGSARGSTQEVAEAVADVLRLRGLAVDVRPAGEVGSVAPYGLVVLGGALYAGRWHKDARRLLRRLRESPGRRDLAVFAMGPRTLEPADVAASRAQLDHALAAAPELRPRWVAVFGGVIRPERLPFPLNRLPASDARDWPAIGDWAQAVAAGHLAKARDLAPATR